jgi:hypothetical protein
MVFVGRKEYNVNVANLPDPHCKFFIAKFEEDSYFTRVRDRHTLN